MQSLDASDRSSSAALSAIGVSGMNGPGRGKTVSGGKTGAEPAGNGSSFLAVIQRMIAGNKDVSVPGYAAAQFGKAGRGAGDGIVPDVEDIQNKLEATSKKNQIAESGKNRKASGKERIEQADAAKKGASGAAGHASGAAPLDPEQSGIRIQSGSAPLSQGLRDAASIDPSGEAGEKEDLGIKLSAENGRKGVKDALLADGMNLSFAAARVADAQINAGRTERSESAGEIDKKDSSLDKASVKGKKAVIAVKDERTQNHGDIQAQNGFEKKVSFNGDNSADMTIGFREAGSGASAGTESAMMRSDEAGRAEQSFASMLSQELRSNAADFVKTGSIVLRDNNAGLIRLTLNPESLGNVRISLELSGDRTITGKIQVSSQEAYDAFRENLETFSDAFVDGGFASAGFDLSWSGQENSGSRNDAAEAAAKAPFYATSIPDVMSSRNPADTDTGGSSWNGRTAINVLA